MLASSVVAIDPGSTTTRVVWLKGGTGGLQVAQTAEYGVGTSNSSLSAIVADLRAKKFPIKALVLGASGQTATLRYNLLPPVPDWRLEMILKYETEEMVEKSGEPLSSAFLQLEVPESQADDRILLVGMGKESQIQPQIDEIEQSGGRPGMVVPQALGLFHAYRQGFARPPSETVLLADLGAVESHIVIACEGRLIFARSVNFGGAQVDEAIAAALGVREDQGKKVKEGLESGKMPEEVVSGTRNAMRSVLGQLVRVVESSISFCRLQTKIPDIAIDRILVSGGTSRLPGLTEYLSEGLATPVERHRPQVTGDLPGDPSQWVLACGLAATAMDREARQLDLLPAPAKAKREFRERTLFMYAAGGVLAVALLIHFGVAFILNMSTQSTFDALSQQEQVAAGFQKRQRDAEESNQQHRSQIDRVKQELATTSFQARVFDSVRRQLPEAISIERVSLARLEDEGQLTVEVNIEGRSDNSDMTGVANVESLVQIVKRIPGVVRAEVDVKALEEDGTYPFSLLVSPQPRPNKDKKRSTRRGPARRKG